MSKLVSQGPLQEINTDWRNPLVHCPPKVLEETVTLISENKKDPLKLTVRQRPQTLFEKTKEINDDSDYGFYVEGGKKKRRTRKTKKSRKSKKTRKSRK